MLKHPVEFFAAATALLADTPVDELTQGDVPLSSSLPPIRRRDPQLRRTNPKPVRKILARRQLLAVNKTYLIHGAWASVAIATFVIGRSGGTDRVTENADAKPSDAASRTAGGLNALPASQRNSANEKNGINSSERNLSLPDVGLSAAKIKAISTEAFNDPSPLKRSLAFTKLLEGLTAENAELVLQSLKDGGAGREQWQLFVYAWGSKDGAGAMDYAATNLEGERSMRFQSEVLTGWASQNPDAAIAWASALDGSGAEDPERLARTMNYALISGLADHDIGFATDYAYRLAEGGDRNASSYFDTIASEQMRKAGLDGALTWAEGLAAGDLKGSALDRVAGTYVNKDPKAAAAWAAQFAGEAWGVRVIEEIGDEWAERDPAASVAWLDTLPQGAGRNEGTYSAFREWAQRDALAASEHLVTMPDSPAKDNAVRGLARTIASKDPESAIAWANTIAEPDMRTETLTSTAREWFRRDRAAATEWLATSGLSPEAQQQVTNPPERRDDRRRRG